MWNKGSNSSKPIQAKYWQVLASIHGQIFLKAASRHTKNQSEKSIGINLIIVCIILHEYFGNWIFDVFSVDLENFSNCGRRQKKGYHKFGKSYELAAIEIDAIFIIRYYHIHVKMPLLSLRCGLFLLVIAKKFRNIIASSAANL